MQRYFFVAFLLFLWHDNFSKEIAETTGFSKNKVIRQINSMIEKHCIKTEGNGRGTKYTVN